MIRDSVLVILPLGGSLSKNVSMLSISSSVVGVTDSGCSCWTKREEEVDSRSQILKMPLILISRTHKRDVFRHSVIGKFGPRTFAFVWVNLAIRRRKADVRPGGGCRVLLRSFQSLRPMLPLSLESDFWSVSSGSAGEAHRAGGVPVTSDAVDAADLRLRAGQRDALEVRPERESG